MWRSEEDAIKDLASLDDFGEDKEPYQVLYSIGRGSRLQKKSENSKTFIDHRTGETIDINDVALDLNDLCRQGKGRGSTIGSLFKTQFQLLKQLRMARPLGSGDEAIESYYRKNRPVENFPKNEPDNVKINSHNKDTLSSMLPVYTEKKKMKIKATRQSKLQSNALIEGLLSKAKKNTELSAKGQKGSTDFNSDDSTKKSNINHSVLPTVGEKEVVFFENDSSNEILSSNCDSDNFSDADSIKDNDSQSKHNSEDIPSLNRCSSPEKNKECDEKYKSLGERLKINEVPKKQNGNGMYDFSHLKKYLLPKQLDSNVPEIIFTEPGVESFVLNEDDFPQLVRK